MPSTNPGHWRKSVTRLAGFGVGAPDAGWNARTDERVANDMVRPRTITVLLAAAFAIAGCGSTGTDSATVASATTAGTPADESLTRDPDVPQLPFADNPDPDACGIPRPWGDGGQAWLTGTWEGELIEPEVLLYDSHLRRSITGSAPHGSEVRIVLFQENPTLDYYLVEVVNDPTQDGWVPAPFLSLDPVV